MAAHLTEAWKEDVRIRTESDYTQTADGWKIAATEVADGEVYRDSAIVVQAFSVPHTNWEHAFGSRFEAGGRSVVISGDTRPSTPCWTGAGGATF